MKNINKSYENRTVTFSSLMSIAAVCCIIGPANATILTLQYTSSGGSLGDGSFHFHHEETFLADGSFVSSTNKASDLTGTINGKFKYDTTAMPADIGGGAFHDYKTIGGSSWSTNDLVATPASGLGLPSFMLSSSGTVATEYRFSTGIGGGMDVIDYPFSNPSPGVPFGGAGDLALFQLITHSVPGGNPITTQMINGQEIPTAINFASLAGDSHIDLDRTVWTANPDGTFTKISDSWSAPLTSITITGGINSIPEPGVLWLIGLGIVFMLERLKRNTHLNQKKS